MLQRAPRGFERYILQRPLCVKAALYSRLLIETDMLTTMRPDVLERIIDAIPMKRLGKPEEIASIVAWLASDEAGFATGADFSLNGGAHMC
jgi:NAD(P)-dependent dehydrogenase (short-subunit alcohol dehydrogenase family)